MKAMNTQNAKEIFPGKHRGPVRKTLFRSAVFRLAFLMFLVIVPICILTLIMSSRAIEMAENQVSEDLLAALDLNMNQLDNYLQNLGRRLYTLSRENEDYAKLMIHTAEKEELPQELQDAEGDAAGTSEPESGRQNTEIEQMHAYLRLSSEFSVVLSEYTWADNVFAYFPDIDRFVSAQKAQASSPLDLFGKELPELQEETHTRWFVPASDENLLLGVFDYRNTFYGASFRLPNLLEQMHLDTSSNIVAFAKNGQGILSDQEELRQIDLESPDKNATVSGEKYLILTSASEYSNLILTDLVSRSQLDRMLPGYMRILLIISIIFLVCIPLLFLAFRYWLARPVNILIDAIDYVDRGNLDYRIAARTGTYEFDLLNSNFNEMMDSVKDLKINVYEKELEKQNIRLQYLSQQIQPHFILNAMNIIYSYEPEEYDLIQKMVLCLSKYFQFIVNANRPYVTIREELDHISNYLKIQKIRYGERIRDEVRMDEAAEQAVMPPLMIQNLVENVIKYALRDDAPVDILVQAEVLPKEQTEEKTGDAMIRILIQDTGYGMKDETLHMIEQFQKTKIRQEGLGVGIQNTIERLELFFGREARFEASRWNQDGGTRITLTFPVKKPESLKLT